MSFLPVNAYDISDPRFAKLLLNGILEGSAWMIEADVALTAAHCLRLRTPSSKVTLEFVEPNETLEVTEILFECKGLDVTLMRISSRTQGRQIPLRRLQRVLNGTSVDVFGISGAHNTQQMLNGLLTRAGQTATLGSIHLVSLAVNVQRFDEVKGMSGGPVLCNSEVIGFNIARGDMAHQIHVRPVSELLSNDCFKENCPSLINISPGHCDLEIYARDGRVHWRGAYAPEDIVMYCALQTVVIDVDGDSSDLCYLHPELKRLSPQLVPVRKVNSQYSWTANSSPHEDFSLAEILHDHLNSHRVMTEVRSIATQLAAGSIRLWNNPVNTLPQHDVKLSFAALEHKQRSCFLSAALRTKPSAQTEYIDYRQCQLFFFLLQIGLPNLKPIGIFESKQNATLEDFKVWITSESAIGTDQKKELSRNIDDNFIDIFIATAIESELDLPNLQDKLGAVRTGMAKPHECLQIVRDDQIADAVKHGRLKVLIEKKLADWMRPFTKLPKRGLSDEKEYPTSSGADH